MNEYTVAFIGHRMVYNMREVEKVLYHIVSSLIERKEYVNFLVGNQGFFDELAASVVRRAQKDFGKANNSLVLVPAYNIPANKYLNNSYDEIYYPHELFNVHFKAAIGERNKYMVKECDLLVGYINKEEGNAYSAFNYGVKLGKTFLNVATMTDKYW